MGRDYEQEWAENWSRRSDEEIATAWIDFQSRSYASVEEVSEDKSWWAVDAMICLSENSSPRALEICFVVARSTKDPRVLESLGAGPLEDILSDKPHFINAVGQELMSNGGLIIALRSMWKSTISDDVWFVLQKLIASP